MQDLTPWGKFLVARIDEKTIEEANRILSLHKNKG